MSINSYMIRNANTIIHMFAVHVCAARVLIVHRHTAVDRGVPPVARTTSEFSAGVFCRCTEAPHGGGTAAELRTGDKFLGRGYERYRRFDNG